MGMIVLTQDMLQSLLSLPYWAYIAAGVGLIVLILVPVLLVRSRKKKKRSAAKKEIVSGNTARPPAPIWDFANLQGIGNRETQQDAFCLSPIDENTISNKGIYFVLADGMGGIQDGQYIAQTTVSETAEMLGNMQSEEDFADVLKGIRTVNDTIYGTYNEQGGTTLLACHVFKNRLRFACVGDSNIYLLRDGRLFELSRRQEYLFDLYLKAIHNGTAISDAMLDPQRASLTSFIGTKHLEIDATKKPFMLRPKDALLLCSDGVSDTLTQAQIASAMRYSPEKCCTQLERQIAEAANAGQDNYTAIAAVYNGSVGINSY